MVHTNSVNSPIISADPRAFTNFPRGRGLINFLPEEEAMAMETYHTWARLFELPRYYSWIIDRFHISTRMYQLEAHGVDYNFRWLEQRLKPLGFRLVFVTCSPGSFEAARAERIKISGNPGQYDNLQDFIVDQEMMRKLVSESMLPALTGDITDNDILKPRTKSLIG